MLMTQRDRLTLEFVVDCLMHDLEDREGFNWKSRINNVLASKFATVNDAVKHFTTLEKYAGELKSYGLPEYGSDHKEYGQESETDIIRFIERYTETVLRVWVRLRI